MWSTLSVKTFKVKITYIRTCLIDPSGVVIDEVIGTRRKANKFIKFCTDPENRARYKGCWVSDMTVREIDL